MGKRGLQPGGWGGRAITPVFHTRSPGLTEIESLSRLLSQQVWEAGFWEPADRLELGMDTLGCEESGSDSTPFAARPDGHETLALCAAVLAEAVLEAHGLEATLPRGKAPSRPASSPLLSVQARPRLAAHPAHLPHLQQSASHTTAKVI